MAKRPKPEIAAWIARERKRLQLKPPDLAAKVGVEPGTIHVWESYANRPPGPDNMEALERVFGTRSPESDAPTGDQAALVAALTRQSEAIERLCSLLALTLERSDHDRARNAIVVEEVGLSLGRIEGTLGLATSQDETAGESPEDARLARQ